MKLTERAYALSTFAALLMILGAVLDLWFYTVGGVAVALYITWRYLAFDAVIKKLALTIERHADKQVVSKQAQVTITLGVTSNVNVTGFFTDVLPDGCELINGANALALYMRKGERNPVLYTVKALKRADIIVEHSTFTIRNDLFSHTCNITSRPLEVKQPVSTLAIEGGSGVSKEAMKSSVYELYRARNVGTGFEFSHIRPYVPGDPLRKIHWKASARLDKLVTKEFFLDVTGELIEGHIVLVIDQGASMGQGMSGHTELDFAVNIASYFVKFAVSKGNKVSLVTYDEGGIVHDIGLGDSQSHVAGIVKTLNQLEPRSAFRAPSHKKSGMTASQARRVTQHFESINADKGEEGINRFREIITYLYSREEGYQHYVQSAPAYKALHTAVRRSSNRATLVLISDFKSDVDPVIEGVKAAISRGLRVYLLPIFSKMFDRYDDPLIAVEDVYVSYEEYKKRLGVLRGISGARVVEANMVDYLEPVLKAVKV